MLIFYSERQKIKKNTQIISNSDKHFEENIQCNPTENTQTYYIEPGLRKASPEFALRPERAVRGKHHGEYSGFFLSRNRLTPFPMSAHLRLLRQILNI